MMLIVSRPCPELNRIFIEAESLFMEASRAPWTVSGMEGSQGVSAEWINVSAQSFIWQRGDVVVNKKVSPFAHADGRDGHKRVNLWYVREWEVLWKKAKSRVWGWEKEKRSGRNSPLQPLEAALVFLISSSMQPTGFTSQGVADWTQKRCALSVINKHQRIMKI